MMQENFVSLLESNVNRFGDRVALLWEGGSLSWSELDRLASGFALWLAGQGVAPRDKVAMLLPNHWSFAVAFLGILKLGGTVATLNPTLKAEETTAILGDLRPKLVVDDVPVGEGVWNMRPLTDSPALIVYTSGSTGRPKGAVFTHEALIFGVNAWGRSVLGLKEEDVVLGVLPFAHNYGMYSSLLAPLLFGAKTVMVEHFTPEAVFEAIAKHRVTVFPGVATMFRRLLNSPAFSEADLSSLRLAVSGAAPCPWELCQEWRERTGTRILRGYGMTEVPRPISYFSDDPNDFPDAIGRPVPGAEAWVVDEAGRFPQAKWASSG